jgi:lysophospholipase L1-like esterase
MAGLSVLTLGLAVFPGVSQAARAPRPYYLSLGDSYSVGYQPGLGSTPGYTGYVASRLKLQAANVGCAGATTTSLLRSDGCGFPASQDAYPYSTITQEQAALDFIAAHPGEVGLVTVSIGGNDFDGCSSLPCVQAAMPTMQSNIESLMSALDEALRAASDASTRVIGLTYPDVDLGLYVYPTNPPTSAQVALAETSITAFDQAINPTLKDSYLSVARGSFVDVTSARYRNATQGDDTSLSRTENVSPYGTVPIAVGEVCQLTYFCSQGNIHANTLGYDFIGKLIVADVRSSTAVSG